MSTVCNVQNIAAGPADQSDSKLIRNAKNRYCVELCLYLPSCVKYLVVWLSVPMWQSGNALDLINVVTLHLAQLVPGWVTVFGQVNHPGTEPGTQVDSASAIPPWVGMIEYWLWLQSWLGKKRRVLHNRPFDQDCWHSVSNNCTKNNFNWTILVQVVVYTEMEIS